MVGYYKIARHFKWALTQVFDNFGHKLVIIIEGALYRVFASYTINSSVCNLICKNKITFYTKWHC